MSWWVDLATRLGRRRPTLLHVARDEGSGPVVILVHGIASSSVTFTEVFPLLVPRHRVIAIDILGFGESPAPQACEYTIEDHVDSLAATIRSLNLREPFILVGHSFGTFIVSRLAAVSRTRAVRRTRVSRVVLVGPPVYSSPTDIGDRRARAWVSAYLRAYSFLRTNKDFTLNNAAIISRLLPTGIFEITERNWTPFVKSLEHSIESQTVVSDVARLRVPVDVIYGALDAFIVPGSMTVIERMRHVTMHRVEANDHLIRKRLARVIARVIDGGAPPRSPHSSVEPSVEPIAEPLAEPFAEPPGEPARLLASRPQPTG